MLTGAAAPAAAEVVEAALVAAAQLLALGLHARLQIARAGKQFTRVEGLRDVVVCPRFQADDAVHLIVPARDEDDADVRYGAQGSREGEPICARQLDVQQHQIGRALLDNLLECFAVFSAQRLETGILEVRVELSARDRFILHDHDERCVLHATPLVACGVLMAPTSSERLHEILTARTRTGTAYGNPP